MSDLKQLLDDIAADAPSGQRLISGTRVRVRQMRRRRSAVAAVAVGSLAASAGVLYNAAQPSRSPNQIVGPAAKPTALPTAAPVEAGVQGPGDGTGPVSAAQRAELADGIVTHDEYVAAFQRMKSCMQADGFWLDVNTPYESNQVMIGVTYPDAASATHDRCYPLEFSLVDATWQGYRENFGPAAKAMADCLTKRGQTPGLTLKEKYEQLSALGVDPYKECVDVTLGR